MTNLHLICQNPLIFHAYNFGNIFTPVKALAPYTKNPNRNIHIVLTINWTLLEKNKAEKFADAYHRHKKKYPWFVITALANEQKEFEILRKLGVRCELCNQNMLLDWNAYRIIDTPHKKFRAVINSRSAPYKRLELAATVHDCALITYFLDKNDKIYFNNIIGNNIKNASSCTTNFLLPQFSNGNYRHLTPEEISYIYGNSKCGLILSAHEGACFAAVEYLLAGLPVVTTKNIGGRDEYFDKDYVVWADDTQESVSAAVEKAISLPISPEEIRERTIAKMREGRKKYISILNDIAFAEGNNLDFSLKWDDFYINKMVEFHTEDEAKRILEKNGVPLHYPFSLKVHHLFRSIRTYLKRE